jgi:YhcH/YjgK/YiaL family protein
MILDRIENLGQYAAVHALLAKAAQFIAGADLASLPVGKHEIDGRRLFVIRDNSQGTGLARARLEAHRKCIDIQIALDRPDVIGYRATAQCRRIAEPYDAAKDVELFDDPAETWLTVPPGSFAIFFPADAHAPLAIDGPVQKAIIKVAVEA